MIGQSAFADAIDWAALALLGAVRGIVMGLIISRYVIGPAITALAVKIARAIHRRKTQS